MIVNNSRGIAMPYVLMIMVLSGIVIEGFLINTNTLQKQQASVQRSVDASLFVKGLSNVLDYAVGCSNALGYGYHTATSAASAVTFDPAVKTPQNVAQIWNPTGDPNTVVHSVLYKPFTGNAAVIPPPPESMATNNMVIRSIQLQRKPLDADALLGTVTVYLTETAFGGTNPPPSIAGPVDPLAPPPATPPVPSGPQLDVQAVAADLIIGLEDISTVRSVFSVGYTRKIELTLYVERATGSSDPWKVVTCTPNQGKVALPGWAGTSDIIPTVPTLNSSECPAGSYAVGMRTNASLAGVTVDLECARMIR